MAKSEGSNQRSSFGIATGIPLGLLLGAAAGLLLIDNLALGAGFGLLLGIVLGGAFDSRSKNTEPE